MLGYSDKENCPMAFLVTRTVYHNNIIMIYNYYACTNLRAFSRSMQNMCMIFCTNTTITVLGMAWTMTVFLLRLKSVCMFCKHHVQLDSHIACTCECFLWVYIYFLLMYITSCKNCYRLMDFQHSIRIESQNSQISLLRLSWALS